MGEMTTSCNAAVGQRTEVVEDVGFEPRHLRWAAAALIDEAVWAATTASATRPRTHAAEPRSGKPWPL